MKKNIGATDKTIRIVIASLVGILYFTDVISGMLALVLGVAAVLLLVTSVINFCPLYALVGTNTCEIEK